MSRGRFLVVEDEFVVAENLRTDLESMGHKVIGLVSSGEEALEIARREKPDLVLMDIKLLGRMDGVEAAIQLRQELDVPVLFLTAFADENVLERAKLAEPLGYLVKPYERKGLRASIEMAHYKVRMERLLRESESRFRSMFENSPVAYLALDESDRCLDLNSELCELLEYSPEELIGKSFFELCAPQMRHLYPDQFAEFRGKQRLQTELELMRKDNALLTVFVEGRLQCDIAGKFLRMHCLLNDITERKRAEVVLRKAHEELEGRVAERTLELTAKTQHLEEVNTALKVLLKQRAEDRGEIEEAIMGNVKNLILPYLEKLKRSRLDNNQETYVAILEAHINEITSTFVRKLSVQHLNLTPTEIQIAALVKEGKTTKEIARILCISEKAISFHRNNIRRKLGLNKRRTNLISYLASLP